MAAARFSDDEWERISGYLEDHSGIYVAQEAPTRRFLEAILWMARAGAPWRLLPAELGPWNSVYKRFARWQEKGVWQMPMDRLAADGEAVQLAGPAASPTASVIRSASRSRRVNPVMRPKPSPCSTPSR